MPVHLITLPNIALPILCATIISAAFASAAGLDTAVDWCARGEALLTRGDAEGAVKAFDEATKRDGKFAKALSVGGGRSGKAGSLRTASRA